MASKFIYLIGLVGAFAPALGASIEGLRQTSLPLSSRIIAQMNQSDAFVENIAVRSNGDLVVTLLNPSASVYTVKEPYSDSPITSLVHTFEGANGTTGISETRPDTLVVVAALIQDAAMPLPNTTWLWELKLGDGDQQATARRMVHIPEARLINGIISVPGSDSTVLAADSQLGVIFRVDVATSEYKVILDTPELKLTPEASIQLGVNGLKANNTSWIFHQIRDGYAYLSNSNLFSIYRFRIDEQGYPIQGAKVEKVVTIEGVSFVDDFTFDRHGNIWVATSINNTVVTVGKDGRQSVVVGSLTELTVAGDSSLAFGKTSIDQDILYVTTSGAIHAPVNGTITEPGKVVAVDARGYY
ncbi:hypothetical protein F4813DRAFT_393377 [Daldinia decipiens]|uniref:uncharacterized protein n=1 Tax=Daldinia decipiens TaxID=326647 RepID=UPI0020C1E43B|nr:uncharacterized protein F4813DRAFT_393377 [Daldinia decipiens]KAI1653794.1 hypothetical protein F4813DRAFT_393377 [Daldinia decipiens]